MSGPILGDLSNNRCSGGNVCTPPNVASITPSAVRAIYCYCQVEERVNILRKCEKKKDHMPDRYIRRNDPRLLIPSTRRFE